MHANRVRTIVLPVLTLLAGATVAWLVAAPSGDVVAPAQPIEQVTIERVVGEDRYCSIPLDGTEVVVVWTETGAERSEVSTIVNNARCVAPLEAETSEVSYAPAVDGDTPNPDY